MKWWESTSEVPIPRSIVQSEIELRWPGIQFTVIVQKPGRVAPIQYEVSWSEGPQNEEVQEFLNQQLGSFGLVVVNLMRMQATEFGEK